MFLKTLQGKCYYIQDTNEEIEAICNWGHRVQVKEKGKTNEVWSHTLVLSLTEQTNRKVTIHIYQLNRI